MRITNRRMRATYIRRMQPSGLVVRSVFWAFVCGGWLIYVGLAIFPTKTSYWFFDIATGELTELKTVDAGKLNKKGETNGR